MCGTLMRSRIRPIPSGRLVTINWGVDPLLVTDGAGHWIGDLVRDARSDLGGGSRFRCAHEGSRLGVVDCPCGSYPTGPTPTYGAAHSARPTASRAARRLLKPATRAIFPSRNQKTLAQRRSTGAPDEEPRPVRWLAITTSRRSRR